MLVLPNRGRVLIEKLLDHTSDVGFVFVLMTPDDMEGTRQGFDHVVSTIAKHAYAPDWLDVVHKSFKPRVRQNVMFEYGLCISSLGRERVCVLLGKDPRLGDLEIPSDVLGYGHISFEHSVSECEEEIKRELQAADYEIAEKSPTDE
jgi:predicted nucleotide-binding protein